MDCGRAFGQPFPGGVCDEKMLSGEFFQEKG